MQNSFKYVTSVIYLISKIILFSSKYEGDKII